MAKLVDFNSEEFKLGQQIQKYRKERGWTQNQLADMLDMDRANIANYENGSKGEMGFKTLLRFSQALGISVDTLLGVEEGDDLMDEIVQLNEENRRTVQSITEGLLLKQKYAV